MDLSLQNSPHGRAGFTLLEIATVIVVIAILLVMLVPAFDRLREKADKGTCIANLRNLYAAASAHVQQNGKWPQIDPKTILTKKYAEEWIAALEPFGITRKNWICPSVQRVLGGPDYLKPANTRIDYLATNFDDNPYTPYRWPKQPWFAERADLHGAGPIFIFTDGTIQELRGAKRAGSGSGGN
jgi:prepilin-type N-terminal cleavage/methylation domain-containing protein